VAAWSRTILTGLCRGIAAEPQTSLHPSSLLNPHLADGSISTITVQRQDIVAAFGLDGYLAAANDDQRGGASRAAAAKGGSTKKRR